MSKQTSILNFRSLNTLKTVDAIIFFLNPELANVDLQATSKVFKTNSFGEPFKKDTSDILRVSLHHFFLFFGQKYSKIRKEKQMEMI